MNRTQPIQPTGPTINLEATGSTVDGDAGWRRSQADGRRTRSLRTRQRLIQAYLQLVRKKRARPTVTEVVQRAGCSRRSLFERFDSVELLTVAALDHAMQDGRVLSGPRPAETDRQTRIKAQAALRARLCEDWWPLWSVAMRTQKEVPELASRIAEMRELARTQLELLCQPELETVAADTRTAVLIALEAVMDFESWSRMRGMHGLSLEQASEVLCHAMDRLLPRFEANHHGSTT
jgi:AcrR family transcriptional regulator